MTTIAFKGKVRTVYNMNDTVAFQYIDIPVLTRKHCNMNEMRRHAKYGSYANSDLFPGMLNVVRRTVFDGRDTLRLDLIPEGVTVDTSGFLAIVSFDV